jgi:hypothetical protein
MMTKNEAVERAAKIWGEGCEVSSIPRSGEAWVMKGGNRHHLDGNGHVDCHSWCRRREEAARGATEP